MAIALIYPEGNSAAWVGHFKKFAPELEISVWPEIDYQERFELAATWYHPPGELAQLNGLRCVASLGAGVDHVFRDPHIPKDVVVTRVVDEGLVREMTEYVVMMVLNHKRGFARWQKHREQKQWVADPDEKIDRIPNPTVGIMGLGRLGRTVAEALVGLGLPTRGWSRTKKAIPGCSSFFGADQLNDFLSGTDILVCLLPLTPETENILDIALFSRLPRGAYLINVGRGGHLVEEDLLEALNNGQLGGACLDVFRKEPLPEKHPFWDHPDIMITPHSSSIADPENVARQITENYHRLLAGEPLLYQVDRRLGY